MWETCIVARMKRGGPSAEFTGILTLNPIQRAVPGSRRGQELWQNTRMNEHPQAPQLANAVQRISEFRVSGKKQKMVERIPREGIIKAEGTEMWMYSSLDPEQVLITSLCIRCLHPDCSVRWRNRPKRIVCLTWDYTASQTWFEVCPQNMYLSTSSHCPRLALRFLGTPWFCAPMTCLTIIK